MASTVGLTRAERVEMILQEVDALPTISPIALRLLRLSSAEDTDIREIVSLVEADPALTGRLLSMCRRANTGLGDAITTVDRAIVMLGFEVVRSTLLSVHMHEMIAGGAWAQRADRAALDAEDGEERFAPIDRKGLWRHELAVACAAELIADEHASTLAVKPDEAFVCGLLHDLGKHALDSILPRTYARAAHIAQRRAIDIAEVERRIMGIDHHAAGKRVGEQWGLQHAIQDVMWLHGQSAESVPDLPHRALIGVVTAADAMVRRLHVGWSGNYAQPAELSAIAAEWGLDPARLERVEARIHENVARRTRELGIEQSVEDGRLALESVLEANRQLGRLNARLHERAKVVDTQSRALGAIATFHGAERAGRTLVRAFADVARSAAELFGDGFYAMIYQSRSGEPWHVCQCAGDGRVLRSQAVEPPPGGHDLASLADPSQLNASTMGMVSWLTDYLGDAQDVRRVHLLPLTTGAGRPALLVHDREIDKDILQSAALRSLTATWAAAIAAAAQHEGARRLGEQLAEANRHILQAQSRLAELESMGRLGELAAGLAHEMNNPLTVISGRGQLLAARLESAETRQAARAIVEASQRLTDLVSSLHFFARPPAARPGPTDLTDLLSRVVRDFRMRRTEDGETTTPVRMVVQGPLPPIWVDGGHLSAVVAELLQNAWESEPRGLIELRAHIDPADDRLVIVVKDDGCGMSEHALRHAFDPFFSEKPAGRQTGLGLARARRLIDLLSGRIELASRVGGGTTARVVLEKWKRPAGIDRDRGAAQNAA